MPGHEFENKVQQKLEELNLPPSGAVWNRVEQEIRKDKRRRRLLLLLPLLLLLGIGGYWAMQSSSGSSITKTDKNIQNDTKNTVTDPAAVVVSPSQSTEQNSTGKDPVNHPNQKTVVGTTEKNTPIVVTEQKLNNPLLNNVEQDQVSNKPSLKKQKPTKTKSVSQSTVGKNKKNTLVPAVTNGNEKITEVATTEEKPVAALAQDKTDPATTIFVDSAQTLSPIAQTANQPLDSIAALNKNSNKETVQTPAVKQTQQSKSWQWGIVGGVGVSKISEGGLFSAFGQAQMMDAAYNGGSTTPPPPGSQPATINPGMNWNVGLFVQRTLNKKLHLSATLQYNYFSTRSDIGTRVDSSRLISNNSSMSLRVESFYLSNVSATGNTRGKTGYRSNYHFLELPITLQFQLNNNNKTPFYWNNGLSIAQLLSTNGLHFDGNTKVYYEDDNLFRKTQLGFHTGLSVKLFAQSKRPLELGPQFNYQFTNLLKPDNADKRHLLSGSLLLRWYIKK